METLDKKARFRFMRESVGLSRAALAARLDVEPRSVQRWERPEAPQMPPADAWAILEDLYVRQMSVVSFAVDKAQELAADLPEDALYTVRLPYWSSAEEHALYSTDAAHGVVGDYEFANANTRAAAAALADAGFVVEVVAGRNNPAKVVE